VQTALDRDKKNTDISGGGSGLPDARRLMSLIGTELTLSHVRLESGIRGKPTSAGLVGMSLIDPKDGVIGRRLVNS
jgi:hypothetical protein